MMHIAFQVVPSFLKLILFTVDKVFRNLFAILVNFIIELEDLLLKYDFRVFVVDGIVLGPYLDLAGRDLNDDVWFEHYLHVGKFTVILLVEHISAVIFDVFEELNVLFGPVDVLRQIFFDIFEQNPAFFASFLLEPEGWIWDTPYNLLFKLRGLLLELSVVQFHAFLVTQCLELVQV